LQLKLNGFHAGFLDFVIHFMVEPCWTLETSKTLGTSEHWKRWKHWEHTNMGGAPITTTTGEGRQSRQQPSRPLSIYLFIYLCMYACIYLSIVCCWKTRNRSHAKVARVIFNRVHLPKNKIQENMFCYPRWRIFAKVHGIDSRSISHPLRSSLTISIFSKPCNLN
jgi:hypothetical protein